jgi:hypothetical protein
MSDRAKQEQHAVLGALAVFDDDQNGKEASRAINMLFCVVSHHKACQAILTGLDCEKFLLERGVGWPQLMKLTFSCGYFHKALSFHFKVSPRYLQLQVHLCLHIEFVITIFRL